MTKMLILDCESYPNYFLIYFHDIESGDLLAVEARDEFSAKDRGIVAGLMTVSTTISFNGISFDLPLISEMVKGASVAQLKELSDEIIESKLPAWKFNREHGIDIPKKWDHIDLIDIAPGQASLKLYGARLGAPCIQDLPYPPETVLTDDQIQVVREYCGNDLLTTKLLFLALKKQIDLRKALSETYQMDLGSSSDAQIAEKVIVSELERKTGKTIKKQSIPDDYRFQYQDPGIVNFDTPELGDLFNEIRGVRFSANSQGQIKLPKSIEGRTVSVGDATCSIGTGGLHSTERKRTLRAEKGYRIVDLDVASYYPNIILQQKLAPSSLGSEFLAIYQELVTRRLKAKAEGNEIVANSLKIVVNASFGKLGSKWSPLFAPNLFVQVTITGQLCLLMLLERLNSAGISIASANTDGVVAHFPEELSDTFDQIIWDWQLDTSFELVATEYKWIASRDVNNYVALTVDGKLKRKGIFCTSGLEKNPQFSIIYTAATNFVALGTPVEETIRASKDVHAFIGARRVTGGATWRGQELGKTVRFYLSREVPVEETIAYTKNTNKVPNSSGSRPCMSIPESFPDDIDYGRYIEMAEDLLIDIGVKPPKEKAVKPRAPKAAKVEPPKAPKTPKPSPQRDLWGDPI